MIFLSRLIVDLHKREGRRDISDCHQMHRTVMSAFADIESCESIRSEHQILYRIQPKLGTQAILYVQSAIAPDISRWSTKPHLTVYSNNPDGYLTIPDTAAIFGSGSIWRFDLLACPAKKTGGSTREERLQGNKTNSRRVVLTNPDSRLDWIERRSANSGFRLLSVAEDGERLITGTKPDGIRIRHESVCFRGHLQVSDSERFQQCIRSGIGAGKAHGLGLLMIAGSVG